MEAATISSAEEIEESATASSVAKALCLLKAFDHGGEFGVSELARRTGIPKSSVHRLCGELSESGFLIRTEDRQYRLSLRVFELGNADPKLARLRQTTSRFLQQLTLITGETVHLGVLNGTDVIYVDKIETPQSEQLPSRVGQRNPVHCTGIGKALAAWSPAVLHTACASLTLPVFTPHTISTGEALRRELERVRDQRVAFDREERSIGIACVASALRDRHGRSVAAVSVSGPRSRMTDRRLGELAHLVERVTRAAQDHLRHLAVL